MPDFIVTEVPSDRELLARILEPELAGGWVKILSAGGKSSAESLARSILAVRQSPVILAVDADATDPEVVAEQQEYLEGALRMVSPNVEFQVRLFVPEIESYLLRDEAIAKRLLGRELSESERIKSDFRPREVLAGSGTANRMAMFSTLSADDLAGLRRVSPFSDMIEFINWSAPVRS